MKHARFLALILAIALMIAPCALAANGYVYDADKGSYRVLTIEPVDTEALSVVTALADYENWPVKLSSIAHSGGEIYVDFEPDSYPLVGASAEGETIALSSIAKTLAMNIEDSDTRHVYYTVAGAPYQSAFRKSEPDEPYFSYLAPRERYPRIDPDVYNSNIDPETGLYIDPETPLVASDANDGQSHASAYDKPLNDMDYQIDVVYDALDLVELAVNSAREAGSEGFSGAPGSAFAWEAIRVFLAKYSTEDWGALDFGLRDGLIQAKNVTAAYDALFAFGRIPPQIETAVPLMTRSGEAYRVEDYLPDIVYLPAINAISVGSESELSVDISVIARSFGRADRFAYNATLSLQPDRYAIYGARITGLWPKDGTARFTEVAVLDEPAGTPSQAPNIIDGDEQSFWTFSSEGASVTFTAPSRQIVRGASMLPFNALDDQSMMDFGRVKSIRFTLSDGNVFEKTFDQDYINVDQWVSIPFEGVHSVTWIRMEIMEIYPGALHDSACMSEIQFF